MICTEIVLFFKKKEKLDRWLNSMVLAITLLAVFLCFFVDDAEVRGIFISFIALGFLIRMLIREIKKNREKKSKSFCPHNKRSHANPKNIVVLDTETTGIGYSDEILQLSIIDYYGNVLFDEYFRPMHHDSWDEAEAINHISPDMVADNPTIFDRRNEIESILSGKTVVGYNVDFDTKMLQRNARVYVDDKIDVMKPFAEVYGEYDSYHGDYRWQKLTTCARYYNYTWEDGDAHDALSDCRATLYCYKKMRAKGVV